MRLLVLVWWVWLHNYELTGFSHFAVIQVMGGGVGERRRGEGGRGRGEREGKGGNGRGVRE